MAEWVLGCLQKYRFLRDANSPVRLHSPFDIYRKYLLFLPLEIFCLLLLESLLQPFQIYGICLPSIYIRVSIYIYFVHMIWPFRIFCAWLFLDFPRPSLFPIFVVVFLGGLPLAKKMFVFRPAFVVVAVALPIWRFECQILSDINDAYS